MSTTPDAAALDAADPLARFVDRFVPSDQVASYLDGNSLGRPLRATAARFQEFLAEQWGGRLIRSWDERWMQLPLELGDRRLERFVGRVRVPGVRVPGPSKLEQVAELRGIGDLERRGGIDRHVHRTLRRIGDATRGADGARREARHGC